MRTPRTIRCTLLGGLLCAAFGAQAQVSQAQVSYRIGAMVPDVGMQALNNAGDMVGTTHFYQEGALLYSNGVLTDLTPRGPGEGIANDINDAGTIVGAGKNGGTYVSAFVYQNGKLRTIDPAGGPSSATHINQIGQVVGTDSRVSKAFVYQNGSLQYLNQSGVPNSTATYGESINDHGTVVGEVEIPDGLPGPDPAYAFVYENGVMRRLDGLSGFDSRAVDINNAGQIVGMDTGVTPGVRSVAYLYDHGKVTRIGNFGGDLGTALAINNLGQVVGWADDATGNAHPYLYQNGAQTDLSAAIPGWRLDQAFDINDKQQIVASGCRLADNQCFALRLDPVAAVPEPSGWAMLGVGAVLGSLLMRRRRASLR